MTTASRDTRLEAGRRVFTQVVAGVDGSSASLEAARQAAVLLDVKGTLTLVAPWDIATTLVGGTGSRVPYYFDEELQRTAAERALRAARDWVAPYAPTIPKLVRGAPVEVLLEEIERDEATLVAVGGCRAGRLAGVIEGSLPTELVHRSPCSVLVSRPERDGFPSRIVVGVDGSVESAAAYAAALHLSRRFGAGLRAVVARGGKGVNERLVAAITDGRHDESRRRPANALVEAGEDADVLVVGSRGLHGVRALGSVSERVAHAAPCSVLVVREASWQRVAEELGR